MVTARLSGSVGAVGDARAVRVAVDCRMCTGGKALKEIAAPTTAAGVGISACTESAGQDLPTSPDWLFSRSDGQGRKQSIHE